LTGGMIVYCQPPHADAVGQMGCTSVTITNHYVAERLHNQVTGI
jgi:hypothetical protein